MRGRKPHKVILQAEQIEILHTHLKTGKTEQRVARRARILLLSHEGKYPWEIADYVGCDRTTVWDFHQRFRERGLDALYDLPRPGAPRRISPPAENSDSSVGLCAAEPGGAGAHPLVQS